MGTQAHPPLNGKAPQFLANVRCGQTVGWTKMSIGTEVGLGPGDLVFEGYPARPRQKGHTHPTQFFGYVYCGQTAGWIKLPLGTEANLGPDDVVLGGVAAPC